MALFKPDQTSVRQPLQLILFSKMCDCPVIPQFRDKESKKAVVRDWRLLKAADASSHCVRPDILTGYRPTLDYLDCLRSILRIHNETVNIW